MKGAVGVLLALVLCLGMAGTGLASEFPTKEVQIVIPWAAGGATDLVFRALAASTPKHLGKAVVVVNKAGGAGAVGYTDSSSRSIALTCEPRQYTCPHPAHWWNS